MVLIKFNDNETNLGRQLLECSNNAKEAKDYGDAEKVICEYKLNRLYDQFHERQLNQRLRGDYLEIDILDASSINLTFLPKCLNGMQVTKIPMPDDIRNLEFDQYGILFHV